MILLNSKLLNLILQVVLHPFILHIHIERSNTQSIGSQGTNCL